LDIYSSLVILESPDQDTRLPESLRSSRSEHFMSILFIIMIDNEVS